MASTPSLRRRPPSVRSVMGFMGGLPAEAYAERGFEVVASWVDVQLRTVVREAEADGRRCR